MLLDEVGAYLEVQGVATLEQDLWLGSRPEEGTDPIIVVAEYPGQAPEYQNDSTAGFGPVRENPQLQIMGRGEDYQAVRAKVQAAWIALSKVTNQVLSGKRYLSIRPNSSPALIGRDQSDRVLVGFNATVNKEV